MDAERARAFLLSLPHVVETRQWGDNLVFWVGDKAIGGKMFCLLNLESMDQDSGRSASERAVVSYPAGAERFAELVEREGLLPAPYFARIFWVAAERWSALRNAEWEDELRMAYAITLAKLPSRARAAIALPPRELAKLIANHRRVLVEREAKSRAGKSRADKSRAGKSAKRPRGSAS
jgi:predicted DNA-binding protein (MmcQ/YjbR family)